jgi:hypothetical protein
MTRELRTEVRSALAVTNPLGVCSDGRTLAAYTRHRYLVAHVWVENLVDRANQ